MRLALKKRLLLSYSDKDEEERNNCGNSFSVKFGRKVQYVNYLHELEPHMDLERLPIPKQVIE